MPFFQPFIGFYSPISEEIFNDAVRGNQYEDPSRAEEFTRGTPEWPHAYSWNVPHHEVVPRGPWQVRSRYGPEQLSVRPIDPRTRGGPPHHRGHHHKHGHRHQHARSRYGPESEQLGGRQIDPTIRGEPPHHHGHRHHHGHSGHRGHRGRESTQAQDTRPEDLSAWINVAMQHELARRRAAERQILAAREAERRQREQEALAIKQRQEQAIRLRLERLRQAQEEMVERARLEWMAENVVEPFDQLVEAISGLQARVLLAQDSEEEEPENESVQQTSQEQDQDQEPVDDQSPQVVYLQFNATPNESEDTNDQEKPSVEEPESPAPEAQPKQAVADKVSESPQEKKVETIPTEFRVSTGDETGSEHPAAEPEGFKPESGEAEDKNTPKDVVDDTWVEVRSAEALLNFRQELSYVGNVFQRIVQYKTTDLKSTKSQLSALATAYAQSEEIYTKLDSLVVPREQRKAKHDLTAAAVDLAEKLESLIANKMRWRNELQAQGGTDSDSDSDMSVISGASEGSTASKKHHVMMETVADESSV